MGAGGWTTKVTPIDDVVTIYQDLHYHRELSFQEARTAGIVAERLTALVFEVKTGVGHTADHSPQRERFVAGAGFEPATSGS
jgi:metal-dependent amidase/aminoacylase/carboxypeptidase family protein